MATFQKFEEIMAWQKARTFVKEVYTMTNQGDFAKDYPLRDQIRRASVSIMANIAEGFERGGTREFIHFVAIAKGSAAEVKTYLYLASDLAYITQEQFAHLSVNIDEISKILGGLTNYLNQTSLKGTKYK